ncbi:GNAT family N-acetyltransferase [Peteryoungia ipomoeae]|uniref:GNAT family N-acetyltransferase n=1 Tax=Peteryoungia ipomoeae TaxID=1210932 RepID=A0A4S8P664_9HYPH|nr:GNAT family N-acetyltransferase [Peteryoungia ipomoeae]THV24851.1 GNAT family N-acetyltransferase [Peteryoungia ipomoeae]
MKDIPSSHPVSPGARWPAGLTIRAIRPDDAEELAALQSLPGCRYGTLRMPYPSPSSVRKHIDDLDEHSVSLAGFIDHIMVGNAGLHRYQGRRSHAASIGMGVHDAYQRRGIGRALLGELVAIADNWLNLRRLDLTVYTDNLAAITLYESFGFEREGIHRDYAYRDGAFVDALVMAKVRKV